MRILAIDVGGSNVKLNLCGEELVRKFPSGKQLTPTRFVEQVRALTGDWCYDAISIGVPGPVFGNVVRTQPVNLGPGWAGVELGRYFDCPVRVMNDAAMQALGSYQGGRMLFLGLGTGLGSALVVERVVVPLELAHLPYKKGRTFEDYVGLRGLQRLGKRKWAEAVADVVARLTAALLPGYVVLGGGNVKKLAALPPGVLRGSNRNAFLGARRMWEDYRWDPASSAADASPCQSTDARCS
ncbi:MAG: ROK family protein [Pirellulales bacterium]|nr:ROK family protein [Pirellulales bacterium]